MDLPLRRVLVNASTFEAYSVFSLDFYLEFVKRHGADPMLFCAGDPMSRAEDEEQYTTIPGWIAYCPNYYPVFRKIETGTWFYVTDPIQEGKSWRTDPRVLALVDEMGVDAAWSPSPAAHLQVCYAPKDVEWEVVRMNQEAEYIRWELPTDRIVGEFRDMLRGKTVATPHPYTALLLADDTITPSAIMTYLKRSIALAEDRWYA